MAPSWLAEGSRRTSSGVGFCFEEASEVGDEVGGRTGRSLGCEVQIAPPGSGLFENVPSSTTQH